MILTGDCLALLPTLDADSVDAIVTDPPYDLTNRKGGSGEASINLGNPAGRARAGGFMGRHWDGTGIAFEPSTWAAMLRVAKPGAHLLAFGATRTEHRMTVAIEDAGWEIRDKLVWAYAQGFPKSTNVGRRIDMARCTLPGRHCMNLPPESRRRIGDHECPPTALGDQHRHEGTALKPAWEPIVMARKPMIGNVAENVLSLGTGALNIDAARIPVDPADPVTEAVWTSRPSAIREGTQGFVTTNEDGDRIAAAPPAEGRWPSNIILTDPIFDGDVPGVIGGGAQASGKMAPTEIAPGGEAFFGRLASGYTTVETPGDAGTYSRFFLVPKADVAQREPIVPTLVKKRPPGWSSGPQSPGTFQSRPTPERENTHPTVKPVSLMQHLVRLVTPIGGLVLDPFLGSGTTAVAAEIEGFRWIGIEREPEYVAMAQARLLARGRGLGLDMEPPRPKRSQSQRERPWPVTRRVGAMASAHGVMSTQRMFEEEE